MLSSAQLAQPVVGLVAVVAALSSAVCVTALLGTVINGASFASILSFFKPKALRSSNQTARSTELCTVAVSGSREADEAAATPAGHRAAAHDQVDPQPDWLLGLGHIWLRVLTFMHKHADLGRLRATCRYLHSLIDEQTLVVNTTTLTPSILSRVGPSLHHVFVKRRPDNLDVLIQKCPHLVSLHLLDGVPQDVLVLSSLTLLTLLDAKLRRSDGLGALFTTLAALSRLHQLKLFLDCRCWPCHADVLVLSTLTNLTSLQLASESYRYCDAHRDTSWPASALSSLAELSSLCELSLRGGRVSELSPMSALTQLSSLDVSHATISNLEGLGSCQKLLVLNVSHTPVPSLQPLSSCWQLQEVDCRNCWNLQDISGLAGCASLRKLLLYAPKLTNISPISACTALNHLQLAGRTELVYHGDTLTDISPLSACTALTHFELTGPSLTDIRALFACANMQVLHLAAKRLKDISSVASLVSMRTVHLTDTELSDIRPLASCSSLEEVRISGTLVSDIRPLAASRPHASVNRQILCQGVDNSNNHNFGIRGGSGIPHDVPQPRLSQSFSNLKRLHLGHSPIRNLRPLSRCRQLEMFSACELPMCTLSGLEGCPNLHTVSATECRQLRDIGAMAACRELKELTLRLCNVRNIRALAACHKLRKLQLIDLWVCDISALEHCAALEVADFRGSIVRDARPLASCPRLREARGLHSNTLNLSMLSPSIYSPWLRPPYVRQTLIGRLCAICKDAQDDGLCDDIASCCGSCCFWVFFIAVVAAHVLIIFFVVWAIVRD